MIRSFIAVPVPREILKECERVSTALVGLGLAGRRVEPSGIHLTLKFLGNVQEDQIPSLCRCLDETAQSSLPFELQVGGLGTFPHPARPRVVWMGVHSSAPLQTLQRNLEEDLQKLGFAREEREFHPHLTLLRLKGGKNLHRLLQFLAEYQSRAPRFTMPVKEMHLYRSLLRPEGARYEVLHTATLEKP